MAPLTGRAAANAIGGYMALGARNARFNGRKVELALRMGKRIRLILRPLRLSQTSPVSRPSRSPIVRSRARHAQARARQPDPHLVGRP